jgi:hypothetical protein
MQTYVRLIVLSDKLSPDDISKMLGVSGSKTWKIGDSINNLQMFEKENGWLLNSDSETNLDFNEHIECLIDSVGNSVSKFKAISELSGCDVQVSYVIYCEDSPPLNIDKDIITWINSMGASLDIDIYI